MKNLNKENFWNELHKQYPHAVEHFCKWIDEYKKEVNWDALFNNDEVNEHISEYQNIKFHDIPIEMQLGILKRYMTETSAYIRGEDKKFWEKAMKDSINEVSVFFEMNEKIIY